MQQFFYENRKREGAMIMMDSSIPLYPRAS
jgi:hypothetical protein